MSVHTKGKTNKQGDLKVIYVSLSVTQKKKLERHMKNHNEDGDWTCNGCSYQTDDQSDLLNHLLEKTRPCSTPARISSK